jgi:hypothetical protein
MNDRYRIAGTAIGLALCLFVGMWTPPAWAQEELFVTNISGASVEAYTRTASGDPNALRRIVGPATGLSSPRGLFLDRVHDELVVANSSSGNRSITVYPLDGNGDIAPVRKLQGVDTGLLLPVGVFVDTVNDELIVANGNDDSITVYPRTATGNVAPIRKLHGAATGLGAPLGVIVDNVNNELLVANFRDTERSITVYARTATGDTAPLRTIRGPATGLDPQSVALDLVHDELVVANIAPPSITVYARTANGNVPPLRTLQGPATGLEDPRSAFLDAVNDELVVANFVNTVTVYPRTAAGNTAPLRTLAGLSNPGFAAVRSAGQPSVDVFLNNDTFVFGGNLVFRTTFSPGTTPAQVDLYVGVLAPDLVNFVSLLQGPGGGIGGASVGHVPVPYASNVTLSDLVVELQHVFSDVEPLGTYYAYAAIVVAGASPLVPANHLGAAVRPFQRVP